MWICTIVLVAANISHTNSRNECKTHLYIIPKRIGTKHKFFQFSRYQLSRSHNSVTFTRVDIQDYASDKCDSLMTVVG